jgi:hypothetical protein
MNCVDVAVAAAAVVVAVAGNQHLLYTGSWHYLSLLDVLKTQITKHCNSKTKRNETTTTTTTHTHTTHTTHTLTLSLFHMAF